MRVNATELEVELEAELASCRRWMSVGDTHHVITAGRTTEIFREEENTWAIHLKKKPPLAVKPT